MCGGSSADANEAVRRAEPLIAEGFRRENAAQQRGRAFHAFWLATTQLQLSSPSQCEGSSISVQLVAGRTPATPTSDRGAAQRPAREVRGRPQAAATDAIDAMLRASGWVIQDRDEVNPLAGQGVAVREFTLATGRADYVLYVDGKIVGVIEAKREGDHLSSAVEQNDRYASGVLKEHRLAVWYEDEPFAFRCATTGTETYFVSRLDPDARSREVFSFHRPETVAAWMRRTEETPAAPTLRVDPFGTPASASTSLMPTGVNPCGP